MATASPNSTQNSRCMFARESGSTHSKPQYLNRKLGSTSSLSTQPYTRKRCIDTAMSVPSAMRKAASQAASTGRKDAWSARSRSPGEVGRASLADSVIVALDSGGGREVQGAARAREELVLDQVRQTLDAGVQRQEVLGGGLVKGREGVHRCLSYLPGGDHVGREIAVPGGDQPIVEAHASAVATAPLEQALKGAQVRAERLHRLQGEGRLESVERRCWVEPRGVAHLPVLHLPLDVHEGPGDDVQGLLVSIRGRLVVAFRADQRVSEVAPVGAPA